ncbi:MAG: L-aspartate oxidase, partial [Arenimonas sp.]
LHLTREGGLRHRRVVHAADATGHAVETSLSSLAAAHPLITVREHCVAVDLILDAARRQDEGVYLFERGRVEAVAAKAVVLATGGANMVYLYSSTPNGASGDGIAMAWRAGCRVANMEFMQFHPTILFHKDSRTFLITEALRGEGALLKLPDSHGGAGERFMPRFDSRAELAPRDVVARAIDHEMKRLGLDFVYLDITHKPASFIRTHFPSIYGRCLELGLDITRQPIPVVPAAHYTCGGVMTDLHGRTDVGGLYAIGEVACTGLHGANRMASNSLLECLVFAQAAAENLHRALPGRAAPGELRPWDESRVTDSDEDIVVSHNWQEVRRTMWDYVGIVRTNKRLARAAHRVALLASEIHEYYGNYKVSSDLIELRNLVVVADLIVRSAQARRESRGLHYTLDYPRTAAATQPTVLPGRA